VIRSEETIAIEFERRLRDVASEHSDVDAFLVQINPRVTAEFTGHGSRVLHALEAETGKSFLFEGSEGLALDHFAITFQGTREEVEERALPFRQGDEVLVEIVEPHMYDVDDAVAKIDGYIISIAGAAAHVGSKRMVRIDQVGRTAASALLLDEAGEVVRAPARATSARNGRGGSSRRTPASGEGGRAGERARSRARGRRAPADSEDADVRREAGLHESATAIDSEPEDTPVSDAEPTKKPTRRRSASSDEQAEGSGGAEDKSQDEGAEDGLQSKPRRRGRRGGRRRSAAKANATPE
jgi:ribonuclease G